MKKQYISTSKAAEILGISRVAVFKKIQKGTLKAEKIGRNYVIDRNEVLKLLDKELNEDEKRVIEDAVKKTIEEYGETLKLLGKE